MKMDDPLTGSSKFLLRLPVIFHLFIRTILLVLLIFKSIELVGVNGTCVYNLCVSGDHVYMYVWVSVGMCARV